MPNCRAPDADGGLILGELVNADISQVKNRNFFVLAVA